MTMASRRRGQFLVAVIVLSTFAAIFFGLRSYGSFLLLRSAYEAGRPQVSSLRAWMTLDHVAATYRVPVSELIPRLGLPPETNRADSLRAIADRRGVARFEFVRQVQRALGQSAPPPDDAAEKSSGGFLGFLGGLSDRVLSAVLTYGYPALAATLLLGAIGLPLPTGLVAVLAGSLAALGHIQLLWAAIIAVMASLGGDALAYLIGRALSESFLARHGRWIGYTSERKERMRSLLQKWGGITVIVSRTLTSSLSSVVSLLAGVSHYRLAHFLGFALAGRLIWTSAYLGLGYGIGGNIEAASQLLGNLSGLLAALAVLVVAGAYRIGVTPTPAR